jgi:hypothetical protein
LPNSSVAKFSTVQSRVEHLLNTSAGNGEIDYIFIQSGILATWFSRGTRLQFATPAQATAKIDKLDVNKVMSVLAGEEELGGNQGADE